MGKKLAAYDAQGNIVGFYDTDYSPAPKGVPVVAITDAMWDDLLAGQAAGKRLVIDDATKTPSLLPPLPPPPEQIVARNTMRRNDLLEQAGVALAPLQAALSLGDATDDEKEAARTWVAFSRGVKVVDLTATEPTWPTVPAIGR